MAVFEFVKGLAVLGGGVALLFLLHKDVSATMEEILRRLRIDPALRLSQFILLQASRVTDTRIWLAALVAVIYALIRFIETYGLWRARPWAEWFAVVSAGLYIPFEIYHFVRGPSLLKAVVFLVNVGIVSYLAQLLAANHRRKKALAESNREKLMVP